MNIVPSPPQNKDEKIIFNNFIETGIRKGAINLSMVIGYFVIETQNLEEYEEEAATKSTVRFFFNIFQDLVTLSCPCYAHIHYKSVFRKLNHFSDNILRNSENMLRFQSIL